jgi:hypothetical protein
VEGVKWLISLYQNGLSGILADQFGLGKTAQVAALLSHLHYHGIRRPHLIVCPTAGLGHWVSQLQQLNPKVPVVMYHGSQQERQEIWDKYLEGGEHSSSSSWEPQVLEFTPRSVNLLCTVRVYGFVLSSEASSPQPIRKECNGAKSDVQDSVAWLHDLEPHVLVPSRASKRARFLIA